MLRMLEHNIEFLESKTTLNFNPNTLKCHEIQRV